MQAIRRLFNLGVIALLLALPFTASAIYSDFLFPTGVWERWGSDSDAGGYAPFHAWIGGGTTQVCVGNGGICFGLPWRSGSWRSRAMSFCDNGESPDTGALAGQTYVAATCPNFGWANFGWFMVDAYPWG